MLSNEFYATLGHKLRARRLSRNITLSEMAKRLHKSPSTVSKYEKGEIFMSIDVLVDICKILSLNISTLLPDTQSSDSTPDAERYQKYFSDRLYLYWYNGEKNLIQTAVLENQNQTMRSTMYYDVANVSDYYQANYIYEGEIMYSDTNTCFVFTCVDPPFDAITIRISSMNRNRKFRIGLLSTISFFYQNIAMKIIASETPLTQNDEFLSTLSISQEEIKNLKRTNFFMVW